MQRLVWVVILLALPTVGTAQEDAQPHPWGLRLIPVKLVDPVNPGLEFQLERQLSKRFATQLTGAWLFKGLSSYYRSLKGARGLAGVKYFFGEAGDPDDKARFYLMAEGGAAVAVHRRDGFFAPRNDTFGQLRIDRYRTVKQTMYYALKIGVQASLAYRWTLDFSVGLGGKRRNVRHLSGTFQPTC